MLESNLTSGLSKGNQSGNIFDQNGEKDLHSFGHLPNANHGVDKNFSGPYQNPGQIDGKRFFGKNLENPDDEMREFGHNTTKRVRDIARTLMAENEKYDKRPHFLPLIINAPLYQIYDESTRRKESRRVRHRIRASIRKRLHGKRGNQALDNVTPSPPDEAILRQLEDSGGDSDSSDNEENLNNYDVPKTNFSRDGQQTSTFRVKRERERPRAGMVTATAPLGEMRNVAGKFAGTGPSRVHWSEMPEVMERNLSANMTGPERNLQEARFEILTSEASYFKSLTVLIDFFYKAPVFDPNMRNAIITAFDKHQLFSNIIDIHVTSENMLHALETSYRKDPMMRNFCDILYEHSESKLSYYVAYVKNQMYQTKTLAKLMSNPQFAELVRTIQSRPECNSLDLNSFLVLPMQRVMRLRLLVAAVLHYTPKSDPAYQSGLVALASIEKLINDCNSQKGLMEQKEHLVTLSSQLEFKSSHRAVGTGSRQLIKESVLRLLFTSNAPSTNFKRKMSDVMRNKPALATLFLFTDILLITKQKGDKYMVEDVASLEDLKVTVDMTPADAEIKRSEFRTKANSDDPFFIRPNLQPSRAVVQTRSRESSEITFARSRNDRSLSYNREHSMSPRHRENSQSRATPIRNTSFGSGDAANQATLCTFIITFQSSDGTAVDYHFLVDSLNVRERWIDALHPGYYSVPSDVTYDTWDCPQMMAINSQGSTQHDELQVREGDLMNVIVELSDGWIKGALPDGRTGWVPRSVCAEVDDPQARRQNMKNFLLSEEASKAYSELKLREKHGLFPRVKDFSPTDV